MGQVVVGFVAGVLVGGTMGFLVYSILQSYTTTMKAPATDQTPVALQMIETNARLMENLLERGLNAVVSSMGQATYGRVAAETAGESPATPSEPSNQRLPPSFAAPPWEDWESQTEVTEQTDLAYPDIVGWVGEPDGRAASVRVLPDFTGENMP